MFKRSPLIELRARCVHPVFSNVFDLALQSVDESIRMATELLMLSGLLKFFIFFCIALLINPYDI